MYLYLKLTVYVYIQATDLFPILSFMNICLQVLPGYFVDRFWTGRVCTSLQPFLSHDSLLWMKVSISLEDWHEKSLESLTQGISYKTLNFIIHMV